MIKFISTTLLPVLVIFLISCQEQAVNPPSPGFDIEASDQEAIAIADEVMEAMGGRKNWDDTRYLSWIFFDFRKLIWDKHAGRVRIESFPDSTIYLVNTNTMEGKVKLKDNIVEDPDTLKMHLDRAKSIWINDAYWLVMPYKLKDSGVTLKYGGEATTDAGALADVLELTFEGVGDTPHNKYDVYVDKDSRLVTQWSFYRNATQDTTNFTTPWNDYQPYGKILLSGDRGQRKLSEIEVFDELPDEVFNEF